MMKLSFALTTLALLAAPALAGNSYAGCKASTHECSRFYSEATDEAGFEAKLERLDREERRVQENNTRVNPGENGGSNSN
jgi:hypothetical protein